jgi:hypothetical protein
MERGLKAKLRTTGDLVKQIRGNVGKMVLHFCQWAFNKKHPHSLLNQTTIESQAQTYACHHGTQVPAE